MIYLPRQSLRKCRNLQVCHFSHFKLNVFFLSNRGHRRWRQHCTTGRCGRRRNWVLAAASSVLSRKKQITPSPERSLGTNRSQGWRAVFCVHAKSIPFNAVSSLDYWERLSFINVEAKTHIFTFTKSNFTDRIYPIFDPCLATEKEGAAPLKNMIVEVTKWKTGLDLSHISKGHQCRNHNLSICNQK